MSSPNSCLLYKTGLWLLVCLFLLLLPPLFELPEALFALSLELGLLALALLTAFYDFLGSTIHERDSPRHGGTLAWKLTAFRDSTVDSRESKPASEMSAS